MKQSELDQLLANVEREIARQNAELRDAIGEDDERLAQWKRVVEFKPVARPRATPRQWMGATRA